MRFFALLTAFCAVLFYQPAPAHAFGHSAPITVESVTLPATTHGQKTLLLDQQQVILQLAHQLLTDSRNRSVIDFAQQQANACWPIQLLPQLARPDGSPLHECGHAYAAALHHLFQQLLRTEGPRDSDLTRLERRFLRSEAFALCSESGRVFTTATVMQPSTRLPNSLQLGLALMLLMGVLALVRSFRRSRAAQTPVPA